MSSNIPDLVNVIGNRTLPIETAYNLHMRDEHTLQQRQIIHILIDCGAVGVFRALISRQYMLAPRYEQTFVGWTIRTMLKIAKSVDSVNQAFQVDIDNIAEQEKLKVYKNEIRLVVKLGAKINRNLKFEEFLAAASGSADVPQLENEVTDADSSKLIENVKEVADGLSNLVSSATKSEEILNEESESSSRIEIDNQLDETVDKVALEQSLDELDAVVEQSAGEDQPNEEEKSEEPEVSNEAGIDVQNSVDQSETTETEQEVDASVVATDESIPLEEDQSEPEASSHAAEVVEEVIEIAVEQTTVLEVTESNQAAGTELGSYKVEDEIQNEPEVSETVVIDAENTGADVVDVQVEVVAEEVSEQIENQTTEVDNSEAEKQIIPENSEIIEAEELEQENLDTAQTTEQVDAEQEIEMVQEADKPLEDEKVSLDYQEVDQVDQNAEDSDSSEPCAASSPELETENESFVVVDNSIESCPASPTDVVQIKETDQNSEIAEVNEKDDKIPEIAPNVDVYQLEYTTENEILGKSDDVGSEKLVLLKQAEDVIFSEVDTGVETRRKRGQFLNFITERSFSISQKVTKS